MEGASQVSWSGPAARRAPSPATAMIASAATAAASRKNACEILRTTVFLWR
jgi:hypothetical protein